MTETTEPSPRKRPMDIKGLPRNPDYGRGIYRRRIRLTGAAGVVHATLDDTHHAMSCTLRHDGVTVTDVAAQLDRIPTTACPGAGFAIRELIGMPLATTMAELYGGGRAQRNCTHLFDLSVLAMAHARRGAVSRLYEVTVPDEIDAPVWIEVRRDGETVHRWRARKQHIVEPAALAGKPLLRGFTPWALQAFAGDDLEAALVLQKGVFVSRARPFIVDQDPDRPVRYNASMAGVCHSYQEPHFSTATIVRDYVRDFTGGVIEAER